MEDKKIIDLQAGLIKRVGVFNTLILVYVTEKDAGLLRRNRSFYILITF
jgi:hypothetical protein